MQKKLLILLNEVYRVKRNPYVSLTFPRIQSMFLHTVAFRLYHPEDSDAEVEFIRAAKKLSKLPGVLDFNVYRQVGSYSRSNSLHRALSFYKI